MGMMEGQLVWKVIIDTVVHHRKSMGNDLVQNYCIYVHGRLLINPS
jgi:hypothetical protein